MGGGEGEEGGGREVGWPVYKCMMTMEHKLADKVGR